jgi:hypothetical protein
MSIDEIVASMKGGKKDGYLQGEGVFKRAFGTCHVEVHLVCPLHRKGSAFHFPKSCYRLPFDAFCVASKKDMQMAFCSLHPDATANKGAHFESARLFFCDSLFILGIV